MRRRWSAVERNEVISVCGQEQKRWLKESVADVQRGHNGRSTGVRGWE